jgi:tRNA pseudouridine13 synthase
MFYTKNMGIGGKIKQRIEDFTVEEIPLQNPRKAKGGGQKENEGKCDDEYLIFWLEKFNWDTNQILKLIAKKLHVAADRFRIAGTKDKRALTRQRVSLWDPDNNMEERLKDVRIRDIKIYNVSRGDRLNLGGLEGNRFVITVRDIGLQEDEIKSRLEALFNEMKKGIPNIFGPQRFGETRPITSAVGKEMLKNDFENAVKAYLADYFEAEPDDAKKARRFLSENWNLEGFKKSLEVFPYRLKNERSMIGYLCEHPQDFAGALRRLPKRLRKMFLNAYQSEIWNRLAEEYFLQERGKELSNIRIPLVGYDTDLDADEPLHRKISDIMKKDRVRLSDFALKGMPELRCSGGERDFLLFPKNLKLLETAEDEFNPGKKAVKISFSLQAGSYATVVLKEIMKT